MKKFDELSRFHTKSACDRQGNERTDRHIATAQCTLCATYARHAVKIRVAPQPIRHKWY